jgi:hypothetical protein
MTLNELSRHHWARMNQAMYMDGALNDIDEVNTWYCLLNWVYYMDIADEISTSHSYDDWAQVSNEARGYFV